jgi:hypothetical protein
MRRLLHSFVLFLLCGQNYAWATTTGLNNIPTADTLSPRRLEVQTYSEVGRDNKPDYFIGVKYGPIKDLEIGLDGRIFPESSSVESAVLQAKYRFELKKGSSLSVGITNLGDRARTGWENPYLVFSQDSNILRLHLGCSLQRDNEGVFFGLDKTVKFLQRGLTLRSDLIQTNDGHDITTSVGFIYDLGNNFFWESWLSFPTQSDKKSVFTIKLDYVIKF